jgi:hypothetical protein
MTIVIHAEAAGLLELEPAAATFDPGPDVLAFAERYSGDPLELVGLTADFLQECHALDVAMARYEHLTAISEAAEGEKVEQKKGATAEFIEQLKAKIKEWWAKFQAWLKQAADHILKAVMKAREDWVNANAAAAEAAPEEAFHGRKAPWPKNLGPAKVGSLPVWCHNKAVAVLLGREEAPDSAEMHAEFLGADEPTDITKEGLAQAMRVFRSSRANVLKIQQAGAIGQTDAGGGRSPEELREQAARGPAAGRVIAMALATNTAANAAATKYMMAASNWAKHYRAAHSGAPGGAQPAAA